MIELGTKEFWEQLSKDPAFLASQICLIDLTNLDQTLQNHPALRAWVNATYESSRIAKERAEWELTKARSGALLKAKEVDDPHTEKAKTVQVLQAEVELDAAVQASTELLFLAEDRCGSLKAMSTALEDRLQMLIQISAKQRQEMRDHS